MNQPLIFAILACVAGTLSLPAQPNDLERATRQLREFLLAPAGGYPSNLESRSHNAGDAEPKSALRFADEIQADGSWPAISYADESRMNWGPYAHVLRMLSMAVALQREALTATEKAKLLNACRLAGGFWRRRDFQCPNWWYNEIGAPQSFGEYALLMGKDLPEEDLRFITGTILARSGIRMTGQNKVWLAGNVLMRALLEHDDGTATLAAQTIWSEVAVVTQEGIQPDWSFHQHGPQQQFGNYGMGFAVEIARWSTILRGTRHALPAEKLTVFRNFLLEGMNWVCWRGAMDISACGRQLMPDSPRSKASTIRRVFENMRLADPEAGPRYAAFVTRNEAGVTNDLVGSRFFWRSDYTVDRRPDSCTTLKMHSARVIGVETVNSENLAGRYLADGALFLYARGDEYSEIFPVLNWRHIPGTTLEAKSDVPQTGKETDKLKTGWVGGVSDGAASVAVLDYDRDGVRARKAWFFKDGLVVCLGNGINGVTGSSPIHTTINQARLRGPVRATTNEGTALVSPGLQELSNVVRVEHAGFVYGLFRPSRLVCTQVPQRGNWSTIFINPKTPKDDVTLDVFSLWIDHGRSPEEASYAYWIAPERSAIEMPDLLANTSKLQALRWSDGLVQAAFWQPGSLRAADDLELEADAPCLIQTQHRGGGWRLCVSDPAQSLVEVTVRLGAIKRKLELPRGLQAGSSIVSDF